VSDLLPADLGADFDLSALDLEGEALDASAARACPADLGRQVCAPRWCAGLWYTQVIADHLAACLRYVRGQPGGIKRLAIAVPFQHGKSTLASELFPAWALGIDPSLRVVCGMYGLSEAKIKCANTRRWMAHPSYLRAFDSRFGPVRVTSEDGDERVDQAESGALSFRVRSLRGGRVEDRGGGYMATSLQAGLNGRPYEIGIVDDPYKDPGDGEDGAANPRKRAKVEEVYDAIFESREQANSVQILVFTRMHPEDLMAYAVDRWAAVGIPHAAIRLPAILDVEAERAPWDPRPLGCGLSEAIYPGAPEIKDAEWYRQKRDALVRSRPWIWETCWQQRPVRREGAMFRAEWWRYFEPEQIRSLQPFDHLWVSVDCAAKASGASWTCADLWACRGAEAYKLDELRGHWDLRAFERELIRWLRETWPAAEGCAKIVEDGGFGRYVVEDLGALDRPIRGFILQGTGGLSKEARASMVIDFVRSGLAHLPNPDARPYGKIRTDWVRSHIAEWGAFPTKGRACDRVDAGTQGLRWHLDRMRAGE
jgi:hypothetical protein